MEGDKIIKNEVAIDDRINFLPEFFGMQFMLYGEKLVYLWMKKLCDEYNGGYWTFYKLSNGGYYMAPASYNMMKIKCWLNYFDGELSSDAAGIIPTMFALSKLFSIENIDETDRFVELYLKLQEYAQQHDEKNLIFEAID